MDVLYYQQRIATKELQSTVSRLRKENKALIKQVKDLRTRCQNKGQRKPFSTLGRTMQWKRKRTFAEAFDECCQENCPPDVKKVKVDIQFEDGSSMSLSPRNADDAQVPASSDILQRVIHIKDKYRISDEALHELHMLQTVVPSKNKLQEEKQRMSSAIPIRLAPQAKDDCAYRHLAEVLEYSLKRKEYRHLLENQEQEIDITCRFSCDGAKISKKKDSVRGVVKVLCPRTKLPKEMSELSMSPDDELTVFFFMGDEKRTNMAKFAAPSFAEMRNAGTNGLVIGEKKVRINWVLTCDWKALTILKGINAANSKYFCIWCHCTKSQICDFSIPSWDIQRSEVTRKKHLDKKDNMGYTAEDLCDFITFKQIVPDDLHLRIRIGLKLLNQVVIWSIDQQSEDNLKAEMARIGVPFCFWEVQGDDNSRSVKKWSQPSGDELLAIIKKTQLHNILGDTDDRRYVTVDGLSVDVLKDELRQRGLPLSGKKAELVARLKQHLEPNQKFQKSVSSRLKVSFELDEDITVGDSSLNVDAIQDLWWRFDELMEALRALPSSPHYMEPEKFKENARQWATDFRRHTFDEDVTPYIHCMVYHVPQAMRTYGYLHDIGVSQVERKNYDHQLAYFGSTNRSGGTTKKRVSLQVLLVTSNIQPDKWVVPGGGVETGESPCDAAIREAFEEAGVRAQTARHLGTVQDDDRRERTSVFALTVSELLTAWPEFTALGRKRRWWAIQEAKKCLQQYKPIQLKFLELLHHVKH